VLGDDALQTALVAFSQEALAIDEGLRVEQPAMRVRSIRLPSRCLRSPKVNSADVVAVQLHEVESPQH
jgi:hypothetical protein